MIARFKSEKRLITSVSILVAAVLILTGTFAWSTIQIALTAGRGINSNYIVKLMDEDYAGVYQYDNWKVGKALEKKVYATSSYLNESIQDTYNDIVQESSENNEDTPHFSNTWVRIKIEETFVHNAGNINGIANTLDEHGRLKSSIPGDYFSLLNGSDVDIITIDEWKTKIDEDVDYEYRGRFWILDESTGWMYWAEPLLATSFIDLDDGEAVDKPQQTTETIIDKVELRKQPSGSWDYKIKATLEAMDVELQDYEADKAWKDIKDATDHVIYQYLLSDPYVAEYAWDGNLMITENTFPDAAFREYLLNDTGTTNDEYNPAICVVDGKLIIDEINKVTKMRVVGKSMASLKGIEHFPNLIALRAYQMPNLTSLDVSSNTKLELLYAYENPMLSSFNLNGLTKLNDAILRDNSRLTSIDFSTNIALSSLNISRSAITSFDLTGNKELVTLTATELPSLTSVDVSGLKKLKTMHIQNNPLLENLVMGENEALETVNFFGDLNLTSLDVSSSEVIRTVQGWGSGVTDLNITGVTTLVTLNIGGCEISSIDVSNNVGLKALEITKSHITSIDLSQNVALTTLTISNNQLTSLDVSNNTQLTKLTIQNNRLTELDITSLSPSLKADTVKFLYDPQYAAEGEKIPENRLVLDEDRSTENKLYWIARP